MSRRVIALTLKSSRSLVTYLSSAPQQPFHSLTPHHLPTLGVFNKKLKCGQQSCLHPRQQTQWWRRLEERIEISPWVLSSVAPLWTKPGVLFSKADFTQLPSVSPWASSGTGALMIQQIICVSKGCLVWWKASVHQRTKNSLELKRRPTRASAQRPSFSGRNSKAHEPFGYLGA